MASRWSPIDDLRAGHLALASTELAALGKVWSERRTTLTDGGLLDEFNQRLARRWAIETGIVERLYTLDRETTVLLIERGIDAALIPHRATDTNPDRLAAILEDHRAALEGLFRFIRGGRELSVSYVKELHAVLTRNQENASAVDASGRAVDVALQRGTFKLHPNSPQTASGEVHEYCPPEQVASEMDRLVELHLEHGRRGVAPEVEAAWLHHRFTQIHPFQDGNGRVARALASLVTIRSGLFPMIVGRDQNAQYIDSLERADQGDLGPLVEFIVNDQRESLVGALSLVRETTEARDVTAVLEAARQDIAERSERALADFAPVKQIADGLVALARERFEAAAEQIRDTLGSLETVIARADSAADGDEHDHYFRYQIVQAARSLDYFADTGPHRAWVRLTLDADPQANILVAIHSVGHRFSGVLAAQASFFRRSRTIEGTVETEAVIPIVDEVFQFNYREESLAVQERFRTWLERALVRGLSHWRQAL